MITGSCLCGSVRYEIRSVVGDPSHCHCSMCRKVHGAAFGTYACVPLSEFSWRSGEESVVTYHSSPGVRRTFCRRCGSTLQYVTDTEPDSFALALGTLDDDPGVRPTHHIFVLSKAPWYDITDDLPQHDADD